MTQQKRTTAHPDNRGKISVAAALAAIGLTLGVETPFWPNVLGDPPSLGVVVAALGLGLCAVHYAMLWGKTRRERG